LNFAIVVLILEFQLQMAAIPAFFNRLSATHTLVTSFSAA
jgi:hypothetical protein